MYQYRENNVQKLRENPNVSYVDKKVIEFSLSFRISLFEKWKKKPKELTIKEALEENGILKEDVSDYLYRELHTKFMTGGYPIHQGKREYMEDTDYKESNPLILSGKYHRLKRHWGLEIDPEFRSELKRTYPDISIEEKMSYLGLDPLDVGYNRINHLKKEFEEEAVKKYTESFENKKPEYEAGQSVTSHELYNHPYVKGIERGELYMTESFFNEVYLLGKTLSEIFELYGIDEKKVSESSKVRIYTTICHWTPVNETNFSSDEVVLSIQRTRLKLMNDTVVSNFKDLGESYTGMTIAARKHICEWIDELPPDPLKLFSKKQIREWTGISKSQYYALLNDDNYGISEIRKKHQDEEDIEVIRQVLAYKGFEKGIRQIYMLMPKITGQQFSIYRIRRLMNKYGIRTTIRRPSRNRKAMKELIARNKKANLLMRKFKLHRPNEVRLTDVTYLDYGEGLRAYGSASVDPVTGKLICFVISENNDLQLALDTLEAMDSYPAKTGAILHSDQGILYMTDDFQTAVAEKELTQSMSRRGNCWDNAVQESFFGHFKDECHYSDCKTFEELQKCIDEYSHYYNNERGMWDKQRMTPVQYEKYLSDMDEETFHLYLAKEKEKYFETKEKAAQRAVQNARDYKASIEEQMEELQ